MQSLFKLSQLRLPLIQAPMAGGINTPELAAAVANAGGVGSFGFAYSTPQTIRQDLKKTKALTAGPINANFFVFGAIDSPSPSADAAALAALKTLPFARDIALSPPGAPYFPSLDDQLEPVWELKPALLSFHFGIPHAGVFEQARALGIAVGITATNLAEAREIERAGADFIVAQGIEAGGHRGMFDPRAPDEKLSALALTAQLARACSLPIATAGGLMTGADIHAALCAGATAAQLGTAFLCCEESGASAAHKAFLLREGQRGSVFTNAFSGRPARGIANEFIRRMEGQPTLPFPLQNTLTASIRRRATQDNNGEYQSLWAGSGYGQARPLAATRLIETLRAEWLARQQATSSKPTLITASEEPSNRFSGA